MSKRDGTGWASPIVATALLVVAVAAASCLALHTGDTRRTLVAFIDVNSLHEMFEQNRACSAQAGNDRRRRRDG